MFSRKHSSNSLSLVIDTIKMYQVTSGFLFAKRVLQGESRLEQERVEISCSLSISFTSEAMFPQIHALTLFSDKKKQTKLNHKLTKFYAIFLARLRNNMSYFIYISFIFFHLPVICPQVKHNGTYIHNHDELQN